MFFKRFTEQLKEYFTFTRKERNGILVLFILLVISQAGIIYTHYLDFPVESDYSAFEEKAHAFMQMQKPYRIVEEEHRSEADTVMPVYSAFDPNTVSEDVLSAMKVPDKAIRSILNFRRKGGKFYKNEDLAKIYTLPETDYQRISEYISIPKPEKKVYSETEKPKEKKAPVIVELNSAGMDELMELPMIGEKRAEQIIKYRSKLGGFIYREQLKEVYSIPDTLYQILESRVTVDPQRVTRININSMNDSTYHPYLKRNLVKLIAAYRLQHGNYASVTDLKKMPLMTDSVFLKVEPYLTVEE